MCSSFFRTFLGLTLCAGLAAAQTGGTAGGGGAASGGGAAAGGGTAGVGTGSVGRNPSPTSPSNPNNTNNNDPFRTMNETNRTIFLSGKVVMEDGTPPPEQVLIERVCNGNPRPEGYTDSKGRFSFQLGQNNQVFADASVGNMGRDPFSNSPQTSASSMRSSGSTVSPLIGCELRATLAGFRSEPVNLFGRRALDNPDVGTMILHRLAKVDGFTFSGTSAYAPKDARKAYEKGKELMGKKKWPEAQKEFEKATSSYEKYAVAWYELGVSYQAQGKVDDAKRCYAESMKADSKYVNPYAQMARLSAYERKWQETADYSDKLLKLNPYHSADVYFYGAVAYLNLNNLPTAEERAREALKMDPNHRLPKINQVLSVILSQKQDYPEAAANMRLYMKYSPEANDLDLAKQQLAEMEKLAGTASAPAQPPAPPQQ